MNVLRVISGAAAAAETGAATGLSGFVQANALPLPALRMLPLLSNIIGSCHTSLPTRPTVPRTGSAPSHASASPSCHAPASSSAGAGAISQATFAAPLHTTDKAELLAQSSSCSGWGTWRNVNTASSSSGGLCDGGSARRATSSCSSIRAHASHASNNTTTSYSALVDRGGLVGHPRPLPSPPPHRHADPPGAVGAEGQLHAIPRCQHHQPEHRRGWSYSHIRHQHSSSSSSSWRQLRAFSSSPAARAGGEGFRDEGLGSAMEVFDRPLKALHRDRSSLLLSSDDPLQGAVAERLLDRLEDCRRRFETAVVLGGAALSVVRQLAGGRAGIKRIIVVDPSQDMLDRIRREEAASRSNPGAKPWPALLCVRGDEEHLPLAPKSVDLIISCMGLHWANDLPGAMAQCRAALVPDGLFLAALLGGDTLQELRISCALAQMEREGGVSPVVSPLAQVRDAGNLLTRADLRLPSVDVDAFRIGYPSALELAQHLRALGEGNANLQRRKALRRDTALAAAAIYQSMFGERGQRAGGQGDGQGAAAGEGRQQEAEDEEGQDCIHATFQVIFMTGWAPAPHQPKAAKRGSATVSFQELATGLVEQGAGVGGTAEGELVGGAASGGRGSSSSRGSGGGSAEPSGGSSS